MSIKGVIRTATLFLAVSTFAQNTQKVPLTNVLDVLSKRYDVSFSYIDQDIATLSAKVPEANLSFRESVAHLQAQLPIDFVFITDTAVALKTKTTPLDQNLAPIQQLQEITITDYITRGITKNVDGSTQINLEKMGLLPGVVDRDILLSIQALPGIQSVNERVSELNLRGGTNDQNLLLWDGIKMYQSGHFFGLISAFNPNLTDKTTVYLNGTPSIYTDGVSGTIAMATANEVTKALAASASMNMLSADVSIDTPLGDRSSLQISGRRALNDVFETPTYNAYFDQAFKETEVITNSGNVSSLEQRFSFFDGSLRWLYRPSKETIIKLNGIFITNDLSYLEQLQSSQTVSSQQSGASQNTLAGGLFIEHQWDEGWTSRLQFYAASYQLDATNNDLVNEQRLFQENDILETSLRLATTYTPASRTQVTAGYQLLETGITNTVDVNTPRFRSSIKEVERAHSFYFQVKHSPLGKGLFAQVGVRGNYFDKLDEFTIAPRMAISYKVDPTFNIGLLGELKTQYTSQRVDFQNDFLGIENRRWVLSNGNSVPLLKSQQLSLNTTYKKRGLLIRMDAYIKQVNGITTRSQSFQNQLQFVDGTGGYLVQGIDVLASKRLRHLKVNLAYATARNNYVWDRNPLIPVQEFTNNVAVNHTLKGNVIYNVTPQLSLGSSFVWHTGKPFTPIAENDTTISELPNYGTPNSGNLPNYFRLDASATYTKYVSKKTQAIASLSFWNILNTRNVINRSFTRIDEETTAINRIALGFTPNASIRVRF